MQQCTLSEACNLPIHHVIRVGWNEGKRCTLKGKRGPLDWPHGSWGKTSQMEYSWTGIVTLPSPLSNLLQKLTHATPPPGATVLSTVYLYILHHHYTFYMFSSTDSTCLVPILHVYYILYMFCTDSTCLAFGTCLDLHRKDHLMILTCLGYQQ